MLIKHLKVSGLLSFGPEGIDLPLESLNVLIGPNGSGKSNFLEVLSLLRAAPTNLPVPVKEMGGVREWLWKGPSTPGKAVIEAVVAYPRGRMPVRHVLEIVEHGERQLAGLVGRARLGAASPPRGDTDARGVRSGAPHPGVRERRCEPG